MFGPGCLVYFGKGFLVAGTIDLLKKVLGDVLVEPIEWSDEAERCLIDDVSAAASVLKDELVKWRFAYMAADSNKYKDNDLFVAAKKNKKLFSYFTSQLDYYCAIFNCDLGDDVVSSDGDDITVASVSVVDAVVGVCRVVEEYGCYFPCKNYKKFSHVTRPTINRIVCFATNVASKFPESFPID